MFYGRMRDLALLEEKWTSGRFEFGCIYGTRRIGKTALINKFLKDKEALYFQAKEASELENRRGVSRLINAQLGYPTDYVFPSWDELLASLLNIAKGKRFAFVIDEYPYLAKATRKGIASYLQDFIDNKARDTQLFIVLLGSNVSFMEHELCNKKSPLYRRRTFSHKLRKLPFSEASLFLRGFSREDACNCLSFFGFSPYYLSLLDSCKSFHENVRSLLFREGATLLDVPDLVLSNGGAREKGVYNTVLLTIARGRRTPTDIAHDMEIGSNEVSRYLRTLVEEEIVEKFTMYNTKRKVQYRISDPVLDFYYRELSDDAERIRIGYGDVVFEENRESIHQFVCHRFEDTCIHYLEEKSLNGELSCPFYPIQNLQIDNTELGRSVEIDGVSRYKDALLMVECKYTKAKRSQRDYADMKEDASIKMFSGVKRFEFWLFSKSGFTPSLKALDDECLHIIGLEEMFGNA